MNVIFKLGLVLLILGQANQGIAQNHSGQIIDENGDEMEPFSLDCTLSQTGLRCLGEAEGDMPAWDMLYTKN